MTSVVGIAILSAGLPRRSAHAQPWSERALGHFASAAWSEDSAKHAEQTTFYLRDKWGNTFMHPLQPKKP